MSKLILTQGLPASGKSTWAKGFINNNPGWVRISRDDLRHMRTPYWIPEQEDMITDWETNCVKLALKRGYNVIVDATNFNNRGIEKFKEIARGFQADFTITPFNTPLDVCIRRDNLRTEGKVGEDVIRGMYNKYIVNKQTVEFIPVQVDLTLPKAIIVDLDGTLAIHNGRNPYDYQKCDTDLVNNPVADVMMKHAETHVILFVSGREDSCYDKTKKWIQNNFGVTNVPLYMRKTGDKRGDDIVKYEIFDEHIRNAYNVEFVLDDRDKVVKMWRKIGLTCLQVAEGNF